MVTVHGRDICESCAYSRYHRCDACSEWHLREECTRVHARGRNQYLCQDCMVSRQVTPCAHCGRLHQLSNLTSVHGGNKVCRGCLHRYYTACEFCDDYHLRPNIHVVEHDDETMRACGNCRESRGLTGTPLECTVPGSTGSDEDPAPDRSLFDRWGDTLEF